MGIQGSGKSTFCSRFLSDVERVNLDKLPNWQKRGVGLYWETFTKDGFNPLTGQDEVAERRRLKVDEDLPIGDAYTEYIAGILGESTR